MLGSLASTFNDNVMILMKKTSLNVVFLLSNQYLLKRKSRERVTEKRIIFVWLLPPLIPPLALIGVSRDETPFENKPRERTRERERFIERDCIERERERKEKENRVQGKFELVMKS